uniref:Uncharacterized protein n=1 Tax=Arundo donax TaxID=35708 RepID=A0A0A9GTP2_ARUDO
MCVLPPLLTLHVTTPSYWTIVAFFHLTFGSLAVCLQSMQLSISTV